MDDGRSEDSPPTGDVRETPAPYGGDWLLGDAHDYVREYCVDLAQLGAFLRATQADAADGLDLDDRHPDPTQVP